MNYFFKPRFFIVGTVSLMLSIGSIASASHLTQNEIASFQAQISSMLNTIGDVEMQLAAVGDAGSLALSNIACPSPRIISDLRGGNADAIVSRNPIVRERGEVTALQDFLWQYKGRYSATYWNPLNQVTDKSDFVTGYYGTRTGNVVRAFQREFGIAYPNQNDSEYGKVLAKTRDGIARQCGALTENQIGSITSLLRSFGVREAMVAQVTIALTDGTPVYVGAPNPTSAQVDAIISLLQSFGARSSVIANVRLALTGSASPLPTIAAPTNLLVSNIRSTTTPYFVELAWRDNSTNEDFFALERSTVASTTGFTTLVNLTPWCVSCAGNYQLYVDDSIVLNQTYYYRIKAVNAATSSAYSNVVSARAVPPIPPPPPPAPVSYFKVHENSATSTPYRVVEAGSVGVPLASYIIEGNSNESILLKQLAFQWGALASSTPAILQNQTVTIWDGATQLGSAGFTGNNATSSTLNLTVPQGQSKVITIRGDLAQINADSLVQNIGGLVRIDYDGDNNGLGGNYATGVSSGSLISGNSPDRRAQGVRVFRSVPSVTSVPCASTLTYGASLHCFRVTASSGRDIALRSVAFDVATSSATVRDFALYGPSGIVAPITNAMDIYDPANSSADANYLRFVFNDTAPDRLIYAGTSKTYSLRANTIYGRGAGYVGALTTRLHEDTAYPRLKRNVGDVYAIENSLGYIPEEKSFIWTAFSTTTPMAQASINSNADWSNGYKLREFPLPWQTATNDMLGPEVPPLPLAPWLYEKRMSATSSSVTLGYSDNGANETGFVLERNTVASSTTGWVQIRSLPPIYTGCPAYVTCATVEDTGLTPGATYYYRLGAVNAAGTSYSGDVTVRVPVPLPPPPPAPINAPALTLIPVSVINPPYSVSLRITDTSTNEASFILERSLTASTTGFSVLSTSPTGCASCTGATYTSTDTITAGVTHYYRAKAANGASESLYSKVVQIYVTPPPIGPIDVTPPIATILIPVGNNAATTTRKSTLPLVGAMFTDKPGSGVATSTAYWKNLTNNTTGALTPSYGWLGGPVTLVPGLNTIEVGARDNAGNLGTARFYATYQTASSTAQRTVPSTLASVINELILLIDELTLRLAR